MHPTHHVPSPDDPTADVVLHSEAILSSPNPIAFQSNEATSIAKEEIMEGVVGPKDVAHMQSVMADLGFSQMRPTPIHVDNAASLLVANAQHPMPHTSCTTCGHPMV